MKRCIIYLIMVIKVYHSNDAMPQNLVQFVTWNWKGLNGTVNQYCVLTRNEFKIIANYDANG